MKVLKKSRRNYLVGFAIILGFVGIYLICTPFRDLWYPDEPDVARVIQEMLLSGEWMRPTLLGKDFASYPPLFYWIAGFFSKILGVSEFFLRLPSVIAGGSLLFVTYHWVYHRICQSAAIWTIVVLGSTFLFFQQAIHVHVDMLFAFFFGLAIFSFDLARHPKQGVSRWGVVLSGLAMGLAAITKGPVGILLPGLVLILDSLIRRRWRDVISLFFCGLISTTIFIGWTLLYANASGANDLLYFIWEQNIKRFIESDSHDRPFYYYLLNFPLDAMPWTLFFFLALPWAIKTARNSNQHYLLLLIWFMAIFIFFNLASSKRSVYLLPLYPAMAGILGPFLAEQSSKLIDKPLKYILIILGSLFIGISIVSIVASIMLWDQLPINSDVRLPLAMLQSLLIIGGVFICGLVWSEKSKQALRMLPVVGALGFLILYGWLFPAMDDPLSAKADTKWLNKNIELWTENLLGAFNIGEGPPKEATALAFYGRFKIVEINSIKELKQFRGDKSWLPLLVEYDELKALRESFYNDIKLIKKFRIGSDKLCVVRINSNNKD